MIAVLKVFDENGSGDKVHQFDLRLAEEKLTVRELIMRRVKAEVERFNVKHADYFNGLVQPDDADVDRQGYKLRHRRDIDVDKQCDMAIDAFNKNGLFLLLNDKQVRSLDEVVPVGILSKISFVKLQPMVGG